MSKIRQLAGDTVLYGLGSMVPRFLNLLLLPIHTKPEYSKNAFSPEQYSIVVDLLAIVAVLNIIYSFGMETTYFRFASKPEVDPKKAFNQAQTAVISISTFLSIFFIAFSPSIAASLDTKPEYIVWLTLIMFIDNIMAIPFASLRLERKPLVFSAAKILNVLLLIGLNIYFLNFNFNPEIGVGYVFLANLIANSFYFLFLGKKLISWKPMFDKNMFNNMLRYAYPIMITGLAGMTNEMFSRITLEWWLPENFYPGKSKEHAVGVFGGCYKYGVFMNLYVQAFRFAAEPFFFSNAADKNSPALFARINHYFLVLGCIFMFGVATNMDILRRVFIGEQYWEGLTIVPILLLAYLFSGLYYNFSVWFKLTDKTYYGTILTVGGTVITVVFNYLLIPITGYEGSSLVTLLCYLSMATACYLIGQKYYPIPYNVGKGILYILITVVLTYMIRAIEFSNPWLGYAFHAVTLLTVAAITYLVEKKTLRGDSV